MCTLWEPVLVGRCLDVSGLYVVELNHFIIAEIMENMNTNEQIRKTVIKTKDSIALCNTAEPILPSFPVDTSITN